MANHRRLALFAAAFLPLSFLSAQNTRVLSPYQLGRQHAIAINELAGQIQSLDDAHKLVNLVAGEFAKELPPRWATRGIRNRIARAEYEAAADPGTLIPEQHVVDVWNDFLVKIGAPPESFVTAAEIYSLRDSQYVTSQFFWARGNQNIWTVPNIWAAGPDGRVADGCRALETLDILWTLGNQPEALTGAREMVRKGERISDEIKNPSKPPEPGTERSYVTLTSRTRDQNPVEVAATNYVRDHGERALNHAIEDLLANLFAH
ncbi:MAG: hypothetical protein ABSE51_12720 [Terracidiphilus sp.]